MEEMSTLHINCGNRQLINKWADVNILIKGKHDLAQQEAGKGLEKHFEDQRVGDNETEEIAKIHQDSGVRNTFLNYLG